MNEMKGTNNSKAKILDEQPQRNAYAIVDQKAIDDIKLARNYAEQGYFVNGNTINELCSKLEVNQDNCVATLRQYQEDSKKGKDSVFGRDIEFSFDKAPFWATKVMPVVQSSAGGIQTNDKAEVLGKNGQVIPGLYAAGATSGHSVFAINIGSGASIVYFVFGRIAGENAAKFVQ